MNSFKKRAFDLYESKNFERRKIKSSLLLQSHLTTALLPDQRKKDRKLFSRSFRVHFDRYFTYLIGYIVSFLTRILIRDLFSFSLLIVSLSLSNYEQQNPHPFSHPFQARAANKNDEGRSCASRAARLPLFSANENKNDIFYYDAVPCGLLSNNE